MCNKLDLVNQDTGNAEFDIHELEDEKARKLVDFVKRKMKLIIKNRLVKDRSMIQETGAGGHGGHGGHGVHGGVASSGNLTGSGVVHVQVVSIFAIVRVVLFELFGIVRHCSALFSIVQHCSALFSIVRHCPAPGID